MRIFQSGKWESFKGLWQDIPKGQTQSPLLSLSLPADDCLVTLGFRILCQGGAQMVTATYVRTSLNTPWHPHWVHCQSISLPGCLAQVRYILITHCQVEETAQHFCKWAAVYFITMQEILSEQCVCPGQDRRSTWNLRGPCCQTLLLHSGKLCWGLGNFPRQLFSMWWLSDPSCFDLLALPGQHESPWSPQQGRECLENPCLLSYALFHKWSMSLSTAVHWRKHVPCPSLTNEGVRKVAESFKYFGALLSLTFF